MTEPSPWTHPEDRDPWAAPAPAPMPAAAIPPMPSSPNRAALSAADYYPAPTQSTYPVQALPVSDISQPYLRYAKIALVFGIVSFGTWYLVFPELAAVFFAIWSLRRPRAAGRAGFKRAIWGLVLGTLAFFTFLSFLASLNKK